jgi:hypothetical protein
MGDIYRPTLSAIIEEHIWWAEQYTALLEHRIQCMSYATLQCGKITGQLTAINIFGKIIIAIIFILNTKRHFSYKMVFPLVIFGCTCITLLMKAAPSKESNQIQATLNLFKYYRNTGWFIYHNINWPAMKIAEAKLQTLLEK